MTLDLSRFDLTSQRLVTGWGARNWSRVACGLARAGANVAVAGCTVATLESTASETSRNGRRSAIVRSSRPLW